MCTSWQGGRRGTHKSILILATASSTSIVLYRDLEHLQSQVAWRAHQFCSSPTPHHTTPHHTTHHSTEHSHTAQNTVTQHRTPSHSTDHTVTQHTSHKQHRSHCHTAHTLTQTTHDYLSGSPHHSVRPRLEEYEYRVLLV